MVGVRGFEPPALGSQNRCATRLRYTPTIFFHTTWWMSNPELNGAQTILVGLVEQDLIWVFLKINFLFVFQGEIEMANMPNLCHTPPLTRSYTLKNQKWSDGMSLDMLPTAVNSGYGLSFGAFTLG
jgi:hypothetical protein